MPTITAPRGSERTARGWPQEAAMRMLMNNLDPDVAERPDDLVVYGGTGKAARDWPSYRALVRTLGKLTVFTISAVQEAPGADGVAHPSPDSVPINIEKPLLRCLDMMRRCDDRKRRTAARKAAEQAQIEQVRAEERALGAYHRKVAYLVAGIIIISLCVYALIWILRTD